MQITINEILLPTLKRIAQENGLSEEQYASNIVQSFLESQYRGELMDEIKKKPIEDIKDLITNAKKNGKLSN